MRADRPEAQMARTRRMKVLAASICVVGAATLACEGLGSLGGQSEQAEPTITPSLTASPTITPSPTATSTAIPAPQGIWSSFSTVNDVSNIEQDGDGYLWGFGPGTIVRWNLGSGTYQSFGEDDGLPISSVGILDDVFIGPEGKVWISFYGQGLWRFDDPEWTPFIEEGEVKGSWLDAYAISPTGDLWICTDEGLSKYDGELWTAYQVSGGAVEGFCEYLTVDGQGNPWMQGTYGVSVLHEPDEWYVFDSIEGIRNPDFEHPIGAFTAPNGTVWFAYSGDYVLWFDGDNWDWANIRPSAFALSTTGQPWVLRSSDIITYAYGGHWQFDPSGNEDPQYVVGYYWPLPFHDRMPTASLATAIYQGLNGEMWIPCLGGLVRVRESSISLIEADGIRDVRDLEITQGGGIYLALADGISRLSGNQLIPLHAEGGLKSNSISELAIAPDGTLWVDTSVDLQTFDGETWATIDAPYSWVYDMQILPNGDVWLAHGFSGLSRWDGSGWEEFEPGSAPDYFDGQVEKIAATDDGRICAGVSPAGISCFDGDQWTGVEFDEGMVVDSLEDIVVDGSGDAYVITWDRENEIASLRRFDGASWTSWEIADRYSALALAPDGSVWLAGREGGIFHIQQGQWGMDLGQGSPIQEISEIQVAQDGSVWVGATNGAWRYNGLLWKSFLPEGALISTFVSEIAIADDGTIWFGGLGLARYGPP